MLEMDLAITPSRPAPSKRRNQSDARRESVVAGVRWMGGAADAKMDSSSRRRASNGMFRRSRPLAKYVEQHNRCRNLLRQQLHSRCSGMKTELERVEVECAVFRDHDFAVEYASARQLRLERLDQFGKVAVQGLFVAAGRRSRRRRERLMRESRPISARRSTIRPLVTPQPAWRASARPAD